jgi:hypothetical protein
MMPVTPVSGQTRGFDTKDGAYLSGTDLGNKPLESGAFDQTGAGAPEIIVNHSDVAEAQLSGTIYQAVLATLALLVMQHLARRGLTDVDDGSPPKVFISQFRVHRFLRLPDGLRLRVLR